MSRKRSIVEVLNAAAYATDTTWKWAPHSKPSDGRPFLQLDIVVTWPDEASETMPAYVLIEQAAK